MKKISFLIAAYNEGEVIHKALERLTEVKKDYPNMEVLVGLDGCTDNTLDIVKKYKFVKYFKLNERSGKQAVLDKLTPHTTGDIILIHDADWVFTYKDKEHLLKFIRLFDDPTIGGIALTSCALYNPDKIKEIRSVGYLANAWSGWYLVNFIKDNCTYTENGMLFIDEKKMLFPPFLDFYKKDVMEQIKRSEKLRAGDHIERTLRILKTSHKILVIVDNDMPHYEVTYSWQTWKDMYKQKVRAFVAREKIKTAYDFKVSFEFYTKFALYLIRHLGWMHRLIDHFAMLSWGIAMFLALIKGKYLLRKDISVNEIWKLRMKEK